MGKKILKINELAEFVSEMSKDKTCVMDIIEMPDGNYEVQWTEQKYYVAQDGKTFPDEIWTTKEGDLINIQDLSEEHAKNIIRMMLRNNREYINKLDNLYKILEEELSMESEESEKTSPPSVTLH